MKLLVVLLTLVLTYIVSISVMINGWGVQPVSWTWITVGFLWSAISALIMNYAIRTPLE
jgi:hypothetical protein